jgi:voltage-gated potassium channel Kch
VLSDFRVAHQGALEKLFVEVVGVRSNEGFVKLNRVVQDGTTMAFLFYIIFVVLREVFRPGTTELDAVVGALCGFVLILTVFMRLHGLLEAWDPGSYQAQGPPLSSRSDLALIAVFQYFSTITLTTVGFGDIVPISPAARLATA